MGTIWVWIVVWSVIWTPPQVQPGSSPLAQKANGDYQKSINEALRGTRFVADKNKSEYKLEKPVDIFAAQPPRRNVAVEYQVGQIDNKPAFATFLMDKDLVPKDPAEADQMLRPNKKIRISTADGRPRPLLQCPNGTVCARTENGQCVEWRCKL